MNRLTRTIQAPGVEVNEIDISQYGLRYDFSNTTMVMLNGFSDMGENYLTDIVTSVKQFTDKFGKPTNEAERYLYNAVKETIRGGGVGVVTKLPYKNTSFEKYTCTKYKLGTNVTPISRYSIGGKITQTLSDMVMGKYSSQLSNDNAVKTFHDYIFDLCGFDSLGSDIARKAEDQFNRYSFHDNLNNVLTGSEYPELKSVLNSNGISDITDFDQMYLDYIGLDDVVFISEGLTDKSGVSADIQGLESNAAYCELNKLSNSITSYVEIKQNDDGNINNYMPYDTYDDLLIGNNQSLNDGDIVIVDVSRTRYQTDKRIKDAEKKISGEYIGLLPVLVSPVNAMLVQGIIKQDKAGFLSNYNLIDRILPIHRCMSNPREYETSINVMSHDNVLGEFAANNNPSMRVRDPEVEEEDDDDYQKMVDIINDVNKKNTFEIFSQLIKSDDPDDSTLGQTATMYFPAIEFTDGGKLDDTYLKQIGVVVFRMYIDPADYNRVNFVPVESYVGSLDKKAKDQLTGKSIYIENIVNQNSENIRVFAKCDFTKDNAACARASTYLIKNQNVRSLGFYENDFDKVIDLGLLNKSLDVVFKKLDNPNLIKLDLLADAGVSNIAQNIYTITKGRTNVKAYYDVDETFNYRILNRAALKEWQKILDKYTSFCQDTRKDLMFLADSPRNLALQGAYKLISRRATAERTVKKDIIPNIKFLANTNTSYGAGYITWFLAVDDTSKDYIWLPPSIKALEAYLIADRDYDFWSAPAGLKRGRMSRVYDVAFNPTEIDAESIYTNRWNYAVSYPLDGIILEGQKTFQKEATAFDRVNVRRLFIRIEKDLKGVGRQFLYEQFTEANLTEFRDDLNNYLTSVQARGGIVEFHVICDGRNNTVQTIENNELHATIAIKPTKTIEFIVLNFICTNQSANVEEVASKYL